MKTAFFTFAFAFVSQVAMAGGGAAGPGVCDTSEVGQSIVNEGLARHAAGRAIQASQLFGIKLSCQTLQFFPQDPSARTMRSELTFPRQLEGFSQVSLVETLNPNGKSGEFCGPFVYYRSLNPDSEFSIREVSGGMYTVRRNPPGANQDYVERLSLCRATN